MQDLELEPLDIIEKIAELEYQLALEMIPERSRELKEEIKENIVRYLKMTEHRNHITL